MSITSVVKKLLFPNKYSSEAYIKYLRRNKVTVGEHVTIYSPMHTDIDIRRPWLISIGDFCKITQNVAILAHDYSVSVPRRVYGEFVGGGLPVTIGNNEFIGENSIILMGTNIGDNCIIGAHSVVKGLFPANSVIAGNPAKVICTLEQFYEKNKRRWVDNAKLCARTIYKNSGHIPTIEEMTDAYAWLYLPRNEETLEKYKQFFYLSSDIHEDIVNGFMDSEPTYNSFEEFLADCNLQ